ncbi:MAG: hypothetical protein CVV23_07180 [Ignavibacteriae bacterium HGW-Ignavibacteriae-2]|jgi:hypothetical protein|nr:MAG: hypothetical protein CVV23_07180 [Ignavibacteriae bacterium HGW-Ignavibacteriae-2]
MRILKIISYILLLSVTLCFGKGQQVVLKVDKPGYVTMDSVYQFSLLLSHKICEYPQTDFYLLVDEGIKINRVRIKTDSGLKDLLVTNSKFSGFYGKVFKSSIFIPDSLYNSGVNTQIVIEVKAPRIKKTEIAFAFNFIKKNKIQESLSSFNSTYNLEKLPVVNIEFYKPQNFAGNSLKLPKSSYIKLKQNFQPENDKLLFCYWAKVKSPDINFLKIYRESGQDTIFNLLFKRSKYDILAADIIDINLENVFVDEYSWNYYAVVIEYSEAKISFYLNGKFSYSVRTNILKTDKLVFELCNNSTKQVHVDNLCLFDFGNGLNFIRSNMNYSKTTSDSSKLIYLESFEKMRNNAKSSESSIFTESRNLEYIKSTAPIFSRIPELKLQSYDNFNEILWKNSDDQFVDYYILERSTDGKTYEDVASKTAEGKSDKFYSLIDQKNKYSEIVYYRIKQINKDNSTTYSSILKVGQGERETFFIEQNYPNPFNPVTTTKVEILNTSEFNIVVYDLVGTKIADIYNGVLEKGIHKFDFDGSNLPSGIYFLEVSSKTSTQAIKMILTK